MKLTASILNWNTEDIVIRSAKRLLDDGVKELSIVDNGSSRRSFKLFERETLNYKPFLDDPRIKYVYLNKNVGFSKGKNIGIRLLSNADQVFLLNGDILYVPGSIDLYQRIMRDYCATCVGMFRNPFFEGAHRNPGTMGVQDIKLAEEKIQRGTRVNLEFGWPLSWPHYGLYSRDTFQDPCYQNANNSYFVEQPPFDGPGHGYEDDWHYASYFARRSHLDGFVNYQFVSVDRPVYFHEQTISKKSLQEEPIKYSSEERKTAYEKYWGCGNWFDRYINKEYTVAREEYLYE